MKKNEIVKESTQTNMSLQIDSRFVMPGDIFFCLVGSANDGHDYAEDAAKNGAAVIVHEHDVRKNEDGGTVYIQVPDTLKALNEAADSFNGFPSKKLTMFGVTGTNGKSSISYMISEIYSKLMAPCGYMGTIGGKLGAVPEDSTAGTNEYKVNLTTPNPIDMHSTLALMLRDGAKAAAIEVSSHGLVQGRVDAVDFDYAIYTNLTREHLDYFHDMDTYCNAKALFFKMLKPDAVAIINVDDEYGQRMIDACTGKVITYGIEGGNYNLQTSKQSTYFGKNINYTFNGMEFDVIYDGQSYHVITDMHVTYNLYNLLAVIATLHQAGLDMESIIGELVHVPTIPGRMSNINCGQDFKVIVDYAHTDDSYEQLLRYVREDMPGVNRIITVNGAPGKRDKQNRQSYAKWIGRFADYAILTEEDPRDESPENIAQEIASFLPADFKYEIIPDRYDAIAFAIKNASSNDVVLILGKGAETYQDRASGKEPWMGDDKAAYEVLMKIVQL